MAAAIPIILCGKSPEMATMVTNSLLPEIDVIHTILSVETGRTEIPAVLQGKDPSSASGNTTKTAKVIGSGDYTKRVVAIALGAGFDDDAVKQLREACKDERAVPWLRPDMTVPRPPLGPEYGKAVVKRLKERVQKLVEEGKVGGDRDLDEVFHY